MAISLRDSHWRTSGFCSIAFVCLITMGLGDAQAAEPARLFPPQSAPPNYYILQAPRPPGGRHAAAHYPGLAQPVVRHSYAYGWFGAPPRRHWSRHFGYYRNFTQWSAR